MEITKFVVHKYTSNFKYLPESSVIHPLMSSLEQDAVVVGAVTALLVIFAAPVLHVMAASTGTYKYNPTPNVTRITSISFGIILIPVRN